MRARGHRCRRAGRRGGAAPRPSRRSEHPAGGDRPDATALGAPTARPRLPVAARRAGRPARQPSTCRRPATGRRAPRGPVGAGDGAAGRGRRRRLRRARDAALLAACALLARPARRVAQPAPPRARAAGRRRPADERRRLGLGALAAASAPASTARTPSCSSASTPTRSEQRLAELTRPCSTLEPSRAGWSRHGRWDGPVRRRGPRRRPAAAPGAGRRAAAGRGARPRRRTWSASTSRRWRCPSSAAPRSRSSARPTPRCASRSATARLSTASCMDGVSRAVGASVRARARAARGRDPRRRDGRAAERGRGCSTCCPSTRPTPPPSRRPGGSSPRSTAGRARRRGRRPAVHRRPAAGRAARAGRRHDGCGQVRAAAGAGRRPRGRQPAGRARLRADRLQGRRGVQGLRPAAAHRRHRHRPRRAPDRASPDVARAPSCAAGRRCCATAGARTSTTTSRARSAGGPSLPRLVLVVDEFATLAEELPDFVGGLVGIAQRGRSLGVHLVLATQRPSGVVSADIRANTTLRIALRVTDPAESADVVDVKDAATISRATPGRAVARIGAGAVMPFQSARVGAQRDGGDAGSARSAVRCGPMPARATATRRPARRPDRPTSRGSSTPRARLPRLWTSTPVPSPWLPPLRRRAAAGRAPATSRVPRRCPSACSTCPAEQRRAPLVLDLEHGGHLLVAGGPRSGRTTRAADDRRLAGAADRCRATHTSTSSTGAAAASPALAALPHCGAVVGRDQVARGDRLLARLARARWSGGSRCWPPAASRSVAEQRAAAEPGDRLPWMVLMVDGWEGVQAAYDEVDHGRPLDVLQRLIREGGAVGLRVVLTGDRGVLTSRVGSRRSATGCCCGWPTRATTDSPACAARQVPVVDAGGPRAARRRCGRGAGRPARPRPGRPGPAGCAGGDRRGRRQPTTELTPAHQRPLRVEPLPARVCVDAVQGRGQGGRHRTAVDAGRCRR